MPTGWQKAVRALWRNIRDLALTMSIIGGVQILVALLVWPLLFRSHRQGFSMALTLVGFGSWLISFASSFGARRGARYSTVAALRPTDNAPSLARPLVELVQTQLERSGCGFLLFLSSLIPLGLAFVLRVQADLRAGKAWSDIFPPMP